MKIQPYIIIPNLIEQPTWGGNYIKDLKQLQLPQKIGQSYELYEHTHLSSNTSTQDLSVELGNPQSPQEAKLIGKDSPIDISTITKEKLPLIKLTQAMSNSYQLHVQTPTKDGQWFSKPESWYYLEPGIITLGAKSNVNWEEYKSACVAIDETAKTISQKIKSQNITLETGRKQLSELISKHHPRQFVNLVHVGKDQVVDLSPCGVHHSWEEDPAKYPLGNVLYEVQLNVYDPVATIRCFDQGKIKSDGSIRNIHIDDYFKYIDRSPVANNPHTYMKKPTLLKKTSLHTIKNLLSTPHYSLDKIIFRNKLQNKFTITTNSFHHLFVSSGNITVNWQNQNWTVTTGYSIFIPKDCGQYELHTYHCYQATVLKTYI